jgi:hypothetical protein
MSQRCPNRVALMAAAVRPPVNPGAAKKAVPPGFRWPPAWRGGVLGVQSR